MESSNKDLFEHYCEINELSVTEQKQYINGLKEHEFELANKLDVLVNNNSDLTQIFTDSLLDFTDENQLASVGDRLTNYKLTQTLGKGGMGQVFKAERCDGKIEQTVAIKFLHPLFYQYQSGKLLLQEAQALAKLNHPNIASIYDIAETDNGNAYIIMEHIEGVTIDVYLQQNSLSVANKLSLFNQVADAVLEAHNNQIIHADIKPSNVLITASGQAKLIDFGVMQLTGELTKSAPKHVTHYLCAMTLNYASPEQLNGDKASISSDIYGLGGLLYFMLSGKSQFEEIGGTLTSKIEHINTQSPDDFSTSDKILFKSDLIGILNKALSKEPKDRYRTATDLINDIQAFQQKKIVSVSASNRFHNCLKFFYRNRIINTALVSTFMIILMALVQLNSKNEQINKEKKSLTYVNDELKRTYSERDKSLADSEVEGDKVYLPDPEKLEPDQYIEIMLLMFDRYYYQGNEVTYDNIIKTLTKWLNKQEDIDNITSYLVYFRSELSGREESDRVREQSRSEQYLKLILQSNTDIDQRVISLFNFLSEEQYDKGKYYPELFSRLIDKKILSRTSLENRILLFYAGSVIFYGRDYEKSFHYSKLAYQLANTNKTQVKLWQYLEIITKLVANYQTIEGDSSEKAKTLTKEFNELVFQLDKSSSHFSYHLGNLLREQLTYGIETYEEVLKKANIDLETNPLNTKTSMKTIYRSNSQYLGILGEYKKAEDIIEQALELITKEEGNDNTTYVYYLSQLVILKLQQGYSEEALLLIEQKILPITKKYDSLQWLGMYQAIYCEKLSLISQTSYVEQLCFDAFNNTLASAGRDSEWIVSALSGLIAWYSLQPHDKKEFTYLDILEKRFDKLAAGKKIRIGLVLEKYFISRKNIEKSLYYQRIVEETMNAYYGSVDAIDRYYHQVMAAELALLKNAPLMAKQNLSKVKDKLCDLDVKNPHRIKYIKLTDSLNMSNCNAI
jgi:serine/threonine protein kinase